MNQYDPTIYNTEEVRKELENCGYAFESHSDTEVVLKAYVEYKEKCAEKFNGIFAFAAYECHSKKLFLCRDRIGVKPLFYCHKGSELSFGSEIKSVLSSGLATSEVNEQGLYEIFFLGPARTSGVGIFKDIEEIKPGEYGVFSDGRLYKNQYFVKFYPYQFYGIIFPAF